MREIENKDDGDCRMFVVVHGFFFVSSPFLMQLLHVALSKPKPSPSSSYFLYYDYYF